MMPPGLHTSHPVRTLAAQFDPGQLASLFKAPVIIVSTPRAGSTLLYEQLAGRTSFWTIGGESHAVFGAFDHLVAENPAMDSGRLIERHADETTGHLLRAGFLYFLKNRIGIRYLDMPLLGKPSQVTFLEKTPRNALNIPFLLKVFPDAKFIYLYRDPLPNIASIIEAWKRGLTNNQFVTFRNLPGWDRPAWCLLLPPGWRELRGKPLSEIATFQWEASNRIIMDDLSTLPRDRQICVDYQNLIENTNHELKRICEFSGVTFDLQEQAGFEALPLSSTTLTPPDPDKWRKYEHELKPLLASIEKVNKRIKAYCQSVDEKR